MVIFFSSKFKYLQGAWKVAVFAAFDLYPWISKIQIKIPVALKILEEILEITICLVAIQAI